MKTISWVLLILFLLGLNAYIYFELNERESDIPEETDDSRIEFYRLDADFLLLMGVASIVLIIAILFWLMRSSSFPSSPRPTS